MERKLSSDYVRRKQLYNLRRDLHLSPQWKTRQSCSRHLWLLLGQIDAFCSSCRFLLKCLFARFFFPRNALDAVLDFTTFVQEISKNFKLVFFIIAKLFLLIAKFHILPGRRWKIFCVRGRNWKFLKLDRNLSWFWKRDCETRLCFFSPFTAAKIAHN